MGRFNPDSVRTDVTAESLREFLDSQELRDMAVRRLTTVERSAETAEIAERFNELIRALQEPVYGPPMSVQGDGGMSAALQDIDAELSRTRPGAVTGEGLEIQHTPVGIHLNVPTQAAQEPEWPGIGQVRYFQVQADSSIPSPFTDGWNSVDACHEVSDLLATDTVSTSDTAVYMPADMASEISIPPSVAVGDVLACTEDTSGLIVAQQVGLRGINLPSLVARGHYRGNEDVLIWSNDVLAHSHFDHGTYTGHNDYDDAVIHDGDTLRVQVTLGVHDPTGHLVYDASLGTNVPGNVMTVLLQVNP
jgi:hypothetical protein